MKLTNKSIVVTGASSGMGKKIVELFVMEGASVVAGAKKDLDNRGLLNSTDHYVKS